MRFNTVLLWVIVIIIFFSSAILSAQAMEKPIAEYKIEVSKTGLVSVKLTINSSEKISLELPKDQPEGILEDAIILKEDQKYQITPKTVPYTISYTTSYYTRKEEGIWYFSMPILNGSTINLTVPKEIQLVQIRPAAFIAKKKQLEIHWKSLEQNRIKLSYVFLKESIEENTNLDESKNSTVTLIISLITLAVLITGTIILRKSHFLKKSKSLKNKSVISKNLKQQRELKQPDISDAQLNIIRAVNKNEALIIEILLKFNNAIKRNQLEKETDLAKSSLASSLKNLEHKKIILIDRSFSTHYITFTEWFTEL